MMPSIKNSCSDCPIKQISAEDYQCYTVDSNLRLQKEVIEAVLYSAGIEGGSKSKTGVDSIAGECVSRVCNNECDMYVMKNGGFSFRSKKDQ